MKVYCETCVGSGKVENDYGLWGETLSCGDCEGKGYIEKSKSDILWYIEKLNDRIEYARTRKDRDSYFKLRQERSYYERLINESGKGG